jgi:RNA polymerase sigma factor (sigma-70 family)
MNKPISTLWESFMKGDEKAFSDIYFAFIDALTNYGKKFTSDTDLINDSLQEIFLDIFQKGKTKHVLIENPKAYLFVSLKNSIIKKLQRNKKIESQEMIGDELLNRFETGYDGLEQIIALEVSEEVRNRLANLIGKLSPKQKEIIYLKFDEGFCYNEISGIMNITVESARKQLYRALSSLRSTMKAEP